MKTIRLSKLEAGWVLKAFDECNEIIHDFTKGQACPVSLYRAMDIVWPKVWAAWPMPKVKRKAAKKKKKKAKK